MYMKTGLLALGVLMGVILAALIGGIGGHIYGVDEGYSDGYNAGRASCSCGIDNCEHMMVISELIHDMAYESRYGEEDLWNYMRYELKEEMQDEGMGEVSEKEWNCFYCDMVRYLAMRGHNVPEDIEKHCEDWGEGVCYVLADTAYIGVK